MASTHLVGRQEHHYLAVLFAGLVLVIVIIAFYSFAIGAFIVYNHPVSNVVAETIHPSPGQTQLAVNATPGSLTPASKRTIWIDPSFSNATNGLPNGVYFDSGYRVANVSSVSDGSLSGTFALSPQDLSKIESDGNTIHSVWIIGYGGTGHDSNGRVLWNLTNDSEENYSTSSRGNGIVLFFSLFQFVLPIQFNIGQLFIFLWSSYVILFAMALNGPKRNIWGALRSAWSKGASSVFDNSLLGMFAAFPVVLWASALAALLQQAVGVSTGSLPPTDGLLLYVSLALAPIREEIGFRVIPIGLVIFLILVFKGRFRDGLLSLWHPSKYLKKNDTPSDYRRHLWIVYFLIGLSAFIFGLAHVLSGSGWGPGKILDAAIGGVALAVLYYQYGLPAAILLHWSIDVFLTTFPSTSAVYDFVALYSVVLAVVSTVVFVYLLVKRVRRQPATGLTPLQRQ